MKDEVKTFLRLMWAGGNYGYLWTLDTKSSFWFPSGDPQDPPAGLHDVYFGVHSVNVIPPTNAEGKKKPPAQVRSQLEYIAAINALFSEFDKDKGATIEQIMQLDPSPSVIIFSGGGWHCYWLLAQTICLTAENRDRIFDIQARWVDFMGGDPGAKDGARVLRLPGTRNYKPAYGAQHPAVEFIRKEFDTRYSFDYLVGLLPAVKPAPVYTRPANDADCLTGNALAGYLLDKALNDKLYRNGGIRNKTCYWLTQQLCWNNISQSEAHSYVMEFQRQVEHMHEPPYTEKEAERELRGGYSSKKPGTPLNVADPKKNETNGHTPMTDSIGTTDLVDDDEMSEEPEFQDIENVIDYLDRTLPPESQQAPQQDAHENTAPALAENAPAAREVTQAAPQGISQKYSTFADLDGVLGPIDFDWYPWLAKGMMTILASESGMGKSILLMRICASYLCSLIWPDGTPFSRAPGCVLWCEAEAAQALNLERAKSWKLPLDKIITPFDDPLADVNLDNPAHQAAITQRALLAQVNFIAVDSLSGSTGRKENDTEIKKITEFLARLARDTNKPVVLTHHFNKGIFGNSEMTLDRLRGSTAIVQHARVIWTLDRPDPAHPDMKRLQVIKNNLRKFPAPIGMSITDAGVAFGQAPTQPKDLSILEQAQALLRELLADGPMKSKAIEAAAEKAGISWRTMATAKKNMAIIDRKKADGTYWMNLEADDDL